MVLFKKENMDSDKPIPVGNLTTLRFVGVNTRQRIIDNMKLECYPERTKAVITTVGVPVEEALSDIGMNYRKVVIHMECD